MSAYLGAYELILQAKYFLYSSLFVKARLDKFLSARLYRQMFLLENVFHHLSLWKGCILQTLIKFLYSLYIRHTHAIVLCYLAVWHL